MSRQSRKQKERRKTIYGWAIGVPSVLAMLAFLVFGQRSSPPLDADLCAVGGLPAEQIAVLLDPSDALSPVQRQSVAPRIVDMLEGDVPEGAEIRVYTVARAGRGDPWVEFRVCLPPHPDSIGSLEGLWQNREIAARRYRESFRDPLEAVLLDLLAVGADSISPIVEAVQAVAVDAFRPREAATPRQLLIVSDMVQNSGDLSFFRESSDFGDFAQKAAYGTLRVDLSAVSVVVFHLARRGAAGRIQAGRLRTFWEDYFLDQGAAAAARPRWVQVEG